MADSDRKYSPLFTPIAPFEPKAVNWRIKVRMDSLHHERPELFNETDNFIDTRDDDDLYGYLDSLAACAPDAEERLLADARLIRKANLQTASAFEALVAN